MKVIPVLRVMDCYLVCLIAGLADEDIIKLQEDILNKLWNEPAKGLVIDLSALDIVDSYMARIFDDIGVAVKTMGAQAVIVGLRPEVAMTLVEMGISLSHLKIALDVESGFQILNSTVKANPLGRQRGLHKRRDKAMERIQESIDSRRDSIFKKVQESRSPSRPSGN
ncbi:MAG: STAS domain-containing protein [Planctomycetota bacterium]|nr:STAS domain-containing protein [Planctomycetota bacterium]